MPTRTKGNIPVRKVQASGIAGAIATIIVIILNSYVLNENKPLTGEFSAALTTVIAFVVGYIVPPGKNEQNILK